MVPLQLFELLHIDVFLVVEEAGAGFVASMVRVYFLDVDCDPAGVANAQLRRADGVLFEKVKKLEEFLAWFGPHC